MYKTTLPRYLVQVCLLMTLTAVLSTCSVRETAPEPTKPVKNFFTKLIQLAEQNSINRRKIDWTNYKTQVWAKVGGAKTVPETEVAMTLALALLKDNHSSIIVDNKRTLYGGIGCQPSPTPFTVAEPNIGYVEVKGYDGSGLEAANFAQAIQNDIARQDKSNTKGWIVDLRRNTGGSIHPMIGGLGPLIGEGTCGYFYDIDDKPVGSFAYQNGVVLRNQTPITQIANPYRPIGQDVKVAVLIGGTTASAGEATALAFVGRPNTKLFGAATCGVSTGNTFYDLPFYGYSLNLFTTKMGDRTGKIYGSAILPDEVVSDDQALAKAVSWIKN